MMSGEKVLGFVKEVLDNMPTDWLKKTTHRLDVYNESKAKVEFLEGLEVLFKENKTETSVLKELPTAYDYIRLGHPLSCLLEWTIAHQNNFKSNNVISFSSNAMPLLAVLRKNLMDRKNTRVLYQGELPAFFDAESLRSVYGYDFDVMRVESVKSISASDETTVFISQDNKQID
jgi:hypothetical protein